MCDSNQLCEERARVAGLPHLGPHHQHRGPGDAQGEATAGYVSICKVS